MDYWNLTQESRALFKSVAMLGYNLILGILWLQSIDPDIYFTILQWFYCTVDFTDNIEIILVEKAQKAICKNYIVFIICL